MDYGVNMIMSWSVFSVLIDVSILTQKLVKYLTSLLTIYLVIQTQSNGFECERVFLLLRLYVFQMKQVSILLGVH